MLKPKLRPVLAVQLHSLVFFKNCSDLVLSGGRRHNLLGACQRGMVLSDDMDFCEPFSNLGFAAAICIYDLANECLELVRSLMLTDELDGSTPGALRLDDVVELLSFSVRILVREMREGQCGPVIVYLEPNEWI